MTKELSTWKEIAALMLARGEKVSVVAEKVNKSTQSIYNAKANDEDFRKLIQSNRDEIVEEVRDRDLKLVGTLYDNTEAALETLHEIMTKSDEVVCKKCGYVISVCPECGEELRVSVQDRDRVTAAKTVVENALKGKHGDENVVVGMPSLVLNMQVNNE